MVSQKQLFLQHVGQTSPKPLLLEIEKARGIYLFDVNGKVYTDLVSGVSVSNVGHCLPQVVDAVKKQSEKFMHLMVYGEYVQSPQVDMATLLTSILPPQLNTVFFVNSGSEANEGAIKLAKRFTGRFEVVAFYNAYHGSTQGALSVLGNEVLKNPFRPLIPGVSFIEFNNEEQLQNITDKTACVIIEPIQAEAGIIEPQNDFLVKLADRCKKTGTLLIFDEVQTGFSRTGEHFAFQHYGIVPDILTVAKGMGGGMPLGAFISSQNIMNNLTFDPALGHITTFGGHPVSCAAAHASLKYIIDNKLTGQVEGKTQLFRDLLQHKRIKQIRGKGLLLAVELESAEYTSDFIQAALDEGIILDYFLFCNTAFRIAPPLIITEKQIHEACYVLLKIIDRLI